MSIDGGESWSSLYNQPTAELYHVTTDTREPYRIYASQQDNTTIAFPSHSRWGGSPSWTPPMWVAARTGTSRSGRITPTYLRRDHKGLITRHDQSTGESRPIMVWPDETAMAGDRDRFNSTCRSSCPARP